MIFELSEEHKAVQQAARDFAETELLSGVIARDEKQEFPTTLVDKMSEMGFMGMTVSPLYNGSGMDNMAYALAIAEISAVDASAGVIMSAHNSLMCWGLEKYGSEELKNKYLTKLACGKAIGAFALSEPDAGSDATAQKTTAIRNGDHYILNGTKNWITNGGKAKFVLVFAQTDVELKHKGINAFIVEKGWDGFDVGPKENKMGIRASDTHSLMFTDVKVPVANRIGEEGFGFKLAMEILTGGRIGIAAQALGIAKGALRRSAKYSTERHSFGKPICEHQAIKFKLADMATKIEAAELLVLKAAWLKDQGKDAVKASAIAKYFAAESAMEITTEAVQIHGGYGYVKEYHVERMMRDAKITQIYEGTSEIQQIVIGREVIKEVK